MGTRADFIPGMDAAGRLVALCWCGESEVWVRPEDVREGRTGVCGRAECHPPDEGDHGRDAA